MKKNLIALAILGAFSGAALAQSNVTLYGILRCQLSVQRSGCQRCILYQRHQLRSSVRQPLGHSRFGSAVPQPERSFYDRRRL